WSEPRGVSPRVVRAGLPRSTSSSSAARPGACGGRASRPPCATVPEHGPACDAGTAMSQAGGTVLIAVDVQRDFLPGGALGVPDGDQVIAPLLELAAQASVVVAS